MLDFKLKLPHFISRIKSASLPVLIYGMGNGADKVIDLFCENGFEILGVTASDDFVRGQVFRGFEVKKLSDFEKTFGDFIIAPAFGSCIPDVMNHIISLSETHRVIYPCVPVAGEEISDDGFFTRNEKKINRARSLFSGESERVFEGYYNFIYSGELKYLLDITSEKEEIYKSFLRPDGRGAYVDIGAYTGDTIEEYLSFTGGKYDEIIAAEPDAKNMAKLIKKFDGYKNLTCVNKVCTSYTGEIEFASAAGRQSAVGPGGEKRECITLDEICAGKDISYIKIDAEGEDMNILKGAAETIRRCRPKLNIAVYHRFADAFEIPLLINEIDSSYRFEMRHHPYIPAWDTNLYAVSISLPLEGKGDRLRWMRC
ncbi:MAG: FkbM family methyltransferase [Clostridia bacterium]|nr:FkbM family methyltransferase [Clostridia bacterium]